MQIIVRDNNVDQALRALKKKLQREGVYREMKLRRHYEKPSEKRAREKAAAVRRARKLERKRLERDGGKGSPGSPPACGRARGGLPEPPPPTNTPLPGPSRKREGRRLAPDHVSRQEERREGAGRALGGLSWPK